MPEAGERWSSLRRLPFQLAAAFLVLLGLAPAALFAITGANTDWSVEFLRWLLVSAPVTVLAALALAVLLGSRVDSLVERGRSLLLLPSPGAFCAVVVTAVVGLAVFFAWYCFGGIPTIGDELSQRFQSDLLVHGRLWAVSPPHPELFDSYQTANIGGRWFSEFPIGGPALLAIGAAGHVAWLVNPVLCGWTAYSLYRFATQITDETTARITAILFAVCSFAFFMSGTEMNHIGSLAFTAWALAATPRWAMSEDPKRVRRAALSIGLAIGCAATIRPYDAVVVAVVIGAFQVLVAWGRPARWRPFAWEIAAGVIPVALLLLVNRATTGHPLLFGYDALNGPAHRPGYHADPYGRSFTFLVGWAQMGSYLLRLNAALFEWPVPAVAILALSLTLKRRIARWDYLLLALAGAVVVAYAAYWFRGDLFGPRFLFTAIPAVLIFTAQMPGALAKRLRPPVLRRATLLLFPVCIVIAWTPVGGAQRFAGIWARAAAFRQAEAYLRIDVARDIADAGLTNAVVFVRVPLRERLAARLRALGSPALMADHLAASLDACALLEALGADDSSAAGPRADRLQHVLDHAAQAGRAEPLPAATRGSSISLIGGRPATASCAREIARDTEGPIPLEVFLPFDDFDSNGRLGGRVIFARDLGTRDSLVRSEFPGRTWYRYRHPTGPDDTGPRFISYSPDSA